MSEYWHEIVVIFVVDENDDELVDEEEYSQK